MSGIVPPDAFRRVDETADELFYRQPRFVMHIDDEAIAAVTQLYRELFPADGVILDLMSSWVSHLPTDVAYSRVVGVGLNRAELATNRQLSEFLVQDLNRQRRLPFKDAEFDGAAICVSIQYLTSPVDTLREVARVLRSFAPLVITFSDRCFPTKAVAIWQSLDDDGHARLIEHYLAEAGGWSEIQTHDRATGLPGADPLFAVVARKTSAQAISAVRG